MTLKRLPLPFVGNKTRYVQFYDVINNIPEDITDVYDMFGGSLYCGYYVKCTHPNMRVHINTYGSNYLWRLKQFKRTREILGELRGMIATKMGKKMNDREVHIVREYIEGLEDDVDWETLSCYLCYKTNNQSTTKEYLLKKQDSQWYMSIPKKLDRIEKRIKEYLRVINSCELFECNYFDYKFGTDTEHNLYIIDPPYINTKNPTYEFIDYKSLLDIMTIIFTDKKHIYFGSNRNPILDLIGCLISKGLLNSKIFKTIRKNSHVRYIDIMIVHY